MNTITLSLNGQSIQLSIDDLPALEAVLIAAARKPGERAFRAAATGRMEAFIDASPGQSGTITSGKAGHHNFNASADSAVILTDC